LPTSLTYIILLARGLSPWRPAADMGTITREIYFYKFHFHGFGIGLNKTRTVLLLAQLYLLSYLLFSKVFTGLYREDNSSKTLAESLKLVACCQVYTSIGSHHGGTEI